MEPIRIDCCPKRFMPMMYDQPPAIMQAAGYLGYLVGTFGEAGDHLDHTFYPNEEVEIPDDFLEDITDLFNDFFQTIYRLRNKAYGSKFAVESKPLSNRASLKEFCNGLAMMADPEEADYRYGIRADTLKYSFLMRFRPEHGWNDIYCFCYRREALEDLMSGRSDSESDLAESFALCAEAALEKGSSTFRCPSCGGTASIQVTDDEDIRAYCTACGSYALL